MTLVVSEHLIPLCWVTELPDTLGAVLHCYLWEHLVGRRRRPEGWLTSLLANEGTELPPPWDTCFVKVAACQRENGQCLLEQLPSTSLLYSPSKIIIKYPLAVNGLPMAEMGRGEKKKTLFLIQNSREGDFDKDKPGKHSQQTLLSFSLLGRERKCCQRSNISMKSSLIISTRVCVASEPPSLERKKSRYCYE